MAERVVSPGQSQPQFTMHVTPQTLSVEGGLAKRISRSPRPTFTRHPPLPPPACLWCWLFQSGLAHAPLVRGFLLVCPYYCDLTRNSPNMAFYTPGDRLALSHPAATEQTGHRGRLGQTRYCSEHIHHGCPPRKHYTQLDVC